MENSTTKSGNSIPNTTVSISRKVDQGNSSVVDRLYATLALSLVSGLVNAKIPGSVVSTFHDYIGNRLVHLTISKGQVYLNFESLKKPHQSHSITSVSSLNHSQKLSTSKSGFSGVLDTNTWVNTKHQYYLHSVIGNLLLLCNTKLQHQLIGNLSSGITGINLESCKTVLSVNPDSIIVQAYTRDNLTSNRVPYNTSLGNIQTFRWTPSSARCNEIFPIYCLATQTFMSGYSAEALKCVLA